MKEVGTALGTCCCCYCTAIAGVLIEYVIDMENNSGFVLDETIVDVGVEQEAAFVHCICQITMVNAE